jgi:hypothetical protein
VAKHRSLRGSLTSRIKEAVFSIFGEVSLPSVNMNTSSSDLSKWKSGAARECYKKLFEPISEDDDQVTYMSRILEKIWMDSDRASDTSIAFAISVCEELLNPDNESIQIKEEVLKYKLRKNQVHFVFYVNNA